MTELKILQGARNLLAGGWCQGTVYDISAGKYCAFGAVWVMKRSYRRRVTLTVPGDWVSITGWNDAKDRTQAEVLEVFDRRIEELSHARQD